MDRPNFHLIVVGAGLSGLVAAAAAANRGQRVALVHGGLGTFVYGAGCIGDLVAESEPEQDHAVAFFQELTAAAGVPFHGRPGVFHALPTILGTLQPVALAPASLWGGRQTRGARVAVVGVAGLSVFDADFVAERLNRHAVAAASGCVYLPRLIDLPRQDGLAHTPLALANHFDREDGFRRLLLAQLRVAGDGCDQMLLPAILGQRTAWDEVAALVGELGCTLGEMPTLPPSAAGMRLSNRLLGHLRQGGVEIFGGHPVRALELADGRCLGVVVDNPGHARRLAADAVILAGGPQSADLVPGWSGRVDSRQRPLNEDGDRLADGLYLAGALAVPAARHGGNGRAVVSGHAAALAALEQENGHATH